jgi:hypothetical protein
MLQHQQRQQAAAARHAIMAQQFGGIQMGVPNGMGQMSPSQYTAMRAGAPMRPVNLPQHLQQAQQQAQQSLEQQQQQAQQQHQVSSYSFSMIFSLQTFRFFYCELN